MDSGIGLNISAIAQMRQALIFVAEAFIGCDDMPARLVTLGRALSPGVLDRLERRGISPRMRYGRALIAGRYAADAELAGIVTAFEFYLIAR